MKIAAIIALLAAVAIGLFVYVQRLGYSSDEHERFESTLWRLKALDANFNEDLLRARFSLLENYDAFERYLGEMDRLALDLQRMPRFVSESGGGEIQRLATSFVELQQQRRTAFERFKSRNAVIANSRRYFPGAVNELNRRLADSAADRELRAIVQELTGVVLMNATTTDELPAEALALPDRLQGWAARHRQHAEAAFVTSLVQHGSQLLSGKSQLDTLTRQLLTLPTAERIEQVSTIYGQELTVALRRIQQYRSLFYAAVTLLVLGGGYALWALRDANRGLEARVAERTRQLQTEVDERKRTEAALQASETFLNSLVENLPVYIFRKDRAGRITFANRRFCEWLGRTREQLLGKTVFDILPAAEAEKQRQLEEEIMTSGRTHEATVEEFTPNGRPAFMHLLKVPVFDAEQRCIGVQAMMIDVTARKQAEDELAKVQQQLLDASRQAGMAEVATGVLHNVGNVLNSVNVSATLVADHVRHSKAGNVAKLAGLIEEHRADLAAFLTLDPRGQMIPDYLKTLRDSIALEQDKVTLELEHLRKNVEHIKDIVAMQQSYARNSGFMEIVPLAELVDDALRMNATSLARHDVELVRDYQVRPTISTDKHKIMQIVINLVRNAKFACDESGAAHKRITVRIAGDAQWVKIQVIDNGIGISAENLTRIFAHGFTTRKTGHGFGLHSGALAAKELGGALSADSDGPGRGATFTLTLPLGAEAKPA